MNYLKNKWNDLSPKHRRISILAVVGAAILLFMFSLPDSEPKQKKQKVQNMKRSILTTSDTRQMGIDAIATKSNKALKENEELKIVVEDLKAQIKEIKDRRLESSDAEQRLTEALGRLQNIETNLEKQGWKLEDITDGYLGGKTTPGSTVQIPGQPQPTTGQLPPSTKPVSTDDPSYYFRESPVAQVDDELDVAGDRSKSSSQLEIITIESTNELADADAVSRIIEVPTGSIMTGTLLNGIDAPAGPQAPKDPYPAIIRIQKDAILPNLFSADLKECLVTVSGYGNLSTERVDMRSERMSCITEDEQIIDVQMDGYVIGDDGKVGVRGKLVHRTGALLANSLLAGSLAGIGDALGGRPIATLASSNQQQYQMLDSQSLQYGVGQGVGKSLDRLSEYWLALAEEIFPVIEIEAARPVDIALSGILVLKPRKTNSLASK